MFDMSELLMRIFSGFPLWVSWLLSSIFGIMPVWMVILLLTVADAGNY